MSGEVIRSIPCPAVDCYGIAYDGRDLWVVADGDHAIYQISILTGAVRMSFGSYDAKPRGLCFDGRSVWCPGDNANGLVRLVVPGGQILQLFPAVSASPITTFFIDGQLFNGTYGAQYQVDIITGTEIRNTNTAGAAAYGASHDGRTLWISDDTNELICQYSLDTSAQIRTFASPTATPRGICFDGRYLYVLDTTGDVIHQVAI